MTLSRSAVRWTLCLSVVAWQGCREEPHKDPLPLRLATTTSTVQSGLVEALRPAFEKQTGMTLEVLASGTGRALELARAGRADVVLVHAREAEDRFLAEGYGLNRRRVMHNDFVLVGPATDPAGLQGTFDPIVALRALSEKKLRFVSRGDESGTHMRERQLWRMAGVEPSGSWYESAGSGMLETLRTASARRGYVLTDRGTFLVHKARLDLQVIVEGDRRLFNPYAVITVNPTRVSGVRFAAAMRFLEFLTSRRARQIIGEFGRKQYGTPLFTPIAEAR